MNKTVIKKINCKETKVSKKCEIHIINQKQDNPTYIVIG